MKKLMIAAAIVCAAALSQAATVTWGTDAFYKPVDAKGTYGTASADKTAKGDVVGYLWEITGDNAKTIWEAYAADTSKIYTEFAKEGHGALGAATVDASKSGVSRNVSMVGTTDWGVGDTAYGLVIYTYNDGKDDWFVANAAKVTGMDAADATVSKLNLYEGGMIGSSAQGDAITGWTKVQAVPEPTSGLLLLLGVAGLALRRRRA